MGDAQLTRTTSGIISLETNDVRRNRQVIPEGNAPMMRRKFALARITERCCMLAANVCTGMEIDKCMQTECGAIRKSTVCTKPTTSSANRTTLPRIEWTRGADGVCHTTVSKHGDCPCNNHHGLCARHMCLMRWLMHGEKC